MAILLRGRVSAKGLPLRRRKTFLRRAPAKAGPFSSRIGIVPIPVHDDPPGAPSWPRSARPPALLRRWGPEQSKGKCKAPGRCHAEYSSAARRVDPQRILGTDTRGSLGPSGRRRPTGSGHGTRMAYSCRATQGSPPGLTALTPIATSMEPIGDQGGVAYDARRPQSGQAPEPERGRRPATSRRSLQARRPSLQPASSCWHQLLNRGAVRGCRDAARVRLERQASGAGKPPGSPGGRCRATTVGEPEPDGRRTRSSRPCSGGRERVLDGSAKRRALGPPQSRGERTRMSSRCRPSALEKYPSE